MCYLICRTYKFERGIIMLKFQNNDTTIIATFEDFILTTYVIIDELYHRFAPSEVRKRRHVLDAKLSDSEIITIALCGELVGIDSENAWFSFVKKNYRHLFPQLCSRSRFNRTRRALMQITELLRQKCALFFRFRSVLIAFLIVFRLQSVNLDVHDTAKHFAARMLITESVLLKRKLTSVIKCMPWSH